MIFVFLVVFGLCLGSFVNALVWRLHKQDQRPRVKGKAKNLSILKGRSMCPRCKHALAGKDLIPVFSWLALGGRCRYCHKPISWQYPIVELGLAAIYVASYMFWPVELSGAGQWVLFISWLVTAVGLMALLVYDLKSMLLPNRIIYPTLAVAAAGRLVYILFFSHNIAHSFWLLALSLSVASGIFWVIYQISGGKWIGDGDIRLGWIIGLVLAEPGKAFLMIFASSLLGTIVVLPALLTGRQKLTGKLPYGPFLIAAAAFCLLFGDSIIHWYHHLII